MKALTSLSGPALIAAMAMTAQAATNLVDDFETCTPGMLDGQNGWVAAADSSVVDLEPGTDNQCLVVATDSTWVSHAAVLPDGETGTLFLRFLLNEPLNFSLGMSDHAVPSRVDDFEIELNLSNSPTVLRVNSGGTYFDAASLETGVWYNAWAVIDNATDVWQLFLHERPRDHANAADQLAAGGRTVFAFRNVMAEHLFTFFVKAGGGKGTTGPLLLDDIYLSTETTIELSNPIAPADTAPAAGMLPGTAGELVTPLLLDRTDSGGLRLEWDFSCIVGDDDYEIYEGLLGDFYSHEALSCTTLGAREAELELPEGNRYYLLVPRNAEREGSYGLHSNGAERPPAFDACLRQHIGECPAL